MARLARDGHIPGMAAIELILVPYDAGHREVGTGRGPRHLMERELPEALTADGHQVVVTEVVTPYDAAGEVAVAFDLARGIADAVRVARQAARLPLVVSGSCFSAMGVVAGLEADRTGVLWVDAHGDLNTPETTRTGALDGMALAAVSGRCWRGMAHTIPGFAPLPDHRLAMVGVRVLDPPEKALAAALGIRRLRCAELARDDSEKVVAGLVERMCQLVDQFYVHVDLDVLDPEVARANQLVPPDGLRLQDVLTVVEMAGRGCGIAGASLVAYDPDVDRDGRAADAAFAIARSIANAAGRAAAGKGDRT